MSFFDFPPCHAFSFFLQPLSPRVIRLKSDQVLHKTEEDFFLYKPSEAYHITP